MVFGGINKQKLQLNEETIWSRESGNNLPKEFSEILLQVRKLIFEEKYKEVEDLVMSRAPSQAAADNNYGIKY